MLPKENRLTKKKDFDLVFKEGKSAKGYFLLCKKVKNNLPDSRFGFMVSKKISNKATVRNKVKRWLRDATGFEIKNIKVPHDVVFIALSGIEKSEFSQIKEVVSKLLKGT